MPLSLGILLNNLLHPEKATSDSNPEFFKGFIISSGRLPVEYTVKNDLSHYQNKKVLIIHGKNDGAIELKYSLAGKNLMEKLGMETQYVIKDRGHGQAPDFYEIVESWLK